MGTWTQANGQPRAGSSRGGAGPTVGRTPNEGSPVFGDGPATRGQRELGGEYSTSMDTPGQERRPAASGPVRSQNSAHRDGGAQSEHQPQSAAPSHAVSAYLAVSERLAASETTE
ncbi:hypothetical protein K438DRAFT_1775993 [Mycena galopus ATCC 62051]|nr:hypothetical protein K438DRAFT_1775993 [Mycena galopus ATCC 62051]